MEQPHMFVCGSKHLDVYDEVYSYINVTILFHKIQTIFGQTGNTPLWEKLPEVTWTSVSGFKEHKHCI